MITGLGRDSRSHCDTEKTWRSFLAAKIEHSAFSNRYFPLLFRGAVAGIVCFVSEGKQANDARAKTQRDKRSRVVCFAFRGHRGARGARVRS
jgi:hypothetical protein